ncbi:MAG: M28 family peptidase [Candidatus Zixiibacteriota bacterium]
MRHSGIIVMALMALTALSCRSGNKERSLPTFDGERAMSYLVAQVEFGPRVPGSASAARCREYIAGFCRNLGAEVDTMQFIHADKHTGKNIEMVNLIARFSGAAGPSGERILLAAHYDCRPRAELDPDSSKQNLPIDGANDGASGVAVLMELANLFAAQKPRLNVDLAFLDGEDFGMSGDLSDYFLGAKEMTRRGIKDKYRCAVVVDMVGDRDLRVYRENFSEQYFPKLNDIIWKTARDIGETTFSDTVGYFVHDDHLSFMTVGLPSVVVIDFAYQYWHTSYDTPDKCSAASLASVGRVMTHFIYNFRDDKIR